MRLLFTVEEEAELRQIISTAEAHTSGEIRIFIENESDTEPVKRTLALFKRYKMYKTRHRNAVLIYIAVRSRHFYIYGDEGIYTKTGQQVWDQAVEKMRLHFAKDQYLEGLLEAIQEIGTRLKQFFPAIDGENPNELSDEILYND